jgi:hypothetical protein
MRRRVTKPKQAMSARQVDRVEKELAALVREGMRLDMTGSPFHQILHRLKKLLASLRRSERR